VSALSTTTYPEGTLVNAPHFAIPEGRSAVIVRATPGAPDRPGLAAALRGRPFRWELAVDSVGLEQWLDLGEETRTDVRGFDFGWVDENLDSLRRVRAAFLVTPGPDVVRMLNFLTSLGFRVRFEISRSPTEQGHYQRALEYYLHNPVLQVPVEPFHSLLVAMCGRTNQTLWDIQRERPGADFFVDDEGSVSLAPRWLTAGKTYGTLNDPWRVLATSPVYTDLLLVEERMHRETSECTSCRHVDRCLGFLRAVDPSWPCEPWQDILDRLDHQVRAAGRLLRSRSA